MKDSSYHYLRVAEELRERIAHQGPNTAMPSEVALARRFGVSRVTIRRSLALLESHGVLSRQQGRGTIANPVKCVRHLIPARPFEEDLAEQGVEFETSIIAFSTESQIPEKMRTGVMHCGLTAGHIVLIHATPSDPLSCEDRYFNTGIVGQLTKSDFEGRPVEPRLTELAGVAISHFEVDTEIHPATAEIGELLKVKPGTLVLSNYYRRYIRDRQPLDFGLVTYRLDLCRFRYSVTSGQEAMTWPKVGKASTPRASTTDMPRRGRRRPQALLAEADEPADP
jgi:DNA-binding GntR family transcriptional regulator